MEYHWRKCAGIGECFGRAMILTRDDHIISEDIMLDHYDDLKESKTYSEKHGEDRELWKGNDLSLSQLMGGL